MEAAIIGSQNIWGIVKTWRKLIAEKNHQKSGFMDGWETMKKWNLLEENSQETIMEPTQSSRHYRIDIHNATEWDWEIRARYIPSCRTPTYQYNFLSTKNLVDKVLFDKMPCRRNVVSTKCRVDEMLFDENCSTKCSVDETPCRRNAFLQKTFDKNFSTKLLRRNVLSTKCLSTNNIAFI